MKRAPGAAAATGGKHHFPRTMPAVAATTTNRINAIPSTPSRENMVGKPSFPVKAVENTVIFDSRMES